MGALLNAHNGQRNVGWALLNAHNGQRNVRCAGKRSRELDKPW